MEASLPDNIREALEFEKSNWSEDTVLDSEFYTVPKDSAESAPGTILKVEKNVDTSKFLLPPTNALSRFLYQSETLKGFKVPVSAFILWPFSPRSQSDGFQVVAWAHGTSGFDANAAPSNHKNLWQHFLAPYQLALQGYVVVGTDYGGLGVHQNAAGEAITHEYLTPPSQAKDVIYSVQAAQQAFSELSRQWVAIGHSQGGGAVWNIAQRAAAEPLKGYLGGVAISPFTNLVEENVPFASVLAVPMVPAIASYFPGFQPSDILTPEGERRLKLVHIVDAGISSAVSIISSEGINKVFKSDWKQNTHFQQYQRLSSNGGRPIQGPLFVAHGTSDPVLSITQARDVVQKTGDMNPKASITFYALANVTHVAALPASQHLWMDWIGDRFAGKKLELGCKVVEIGGVRGQGHQEDQNWYLATATEPWQAPGP